MHITSRACIGWHIGGAYAMMKNAIARIQGSAKYPQLHGTVQFRQCRNGVLVTAEVYGLPSRDDQGIFAFHIHDGHACTGNENDPFADAGRHLNPGGMPHPSHAGDLPPLFENYGYAYMKVFTNRFCVEDIISHVVIIHDQPDDFTTQPSGNSGAKIACGKIVVA